jgi:hypothetical protein
MALRVQRFLHAFITSHLAPTNTPQPHSRATFISVLRQALAFMDPPISTYTCLRLQLVFVLHPHPSSFGFSVLATRPVVFSFCMPSAPRSHVHADAFAKSTDSYFVYLTQQWSASRVGSLQMVFLNSLKILNREGYHVTRHILNVYFGRSDTSCRRIHLIEFIPAINALYRRPH